MTIQEAIKNWGVDKTAEMIAILKNAGSKHILNDFKTTLNVNDEDIELLITMPSEAYYASEGRSAGKFPNVNAIKKWAAERGIPNKAVYPISKHIAKFGTKESGLKFLELFKADDKLEKSIAEAYKEDIKNKLIDIVNNN